MVASQMVLQTVEKLKTSNIRITPQRFAVLEYLIETDSHPTADEIYQALVERFPNVSVATIYNNLRLFTKIGFVKEMTYGDDSSRFDFSTTQHYHAICEKCGKIEDIYYPGLEDIEETAHHLTGYKVTNHRMEVYGICPDCQALQDKK